MKNKLITIILCFVFLFTFSLSCFASDFLLDGKYDISKKIGEPISSSFTYQLTFSDNLGNLYENVNLTYSSGKLTYSYPYGNSKTFSSDIKYLIFDKQSVSESFYNNLTSVYSLARVNPSDFTSIFESLKEQISGATVVEVLAVVVGACAGLAFMWWGVRKIIKALMSAFKKGKVSV